MNGFTRNAEHDFNSWKWSHLASGVASSEIWGEQKFDFRRITLFCLENASQSTKSLYFLNIWGAHGPFGPPGYGYASGLELLQ